MRRHGGWVDPTSLLVLVGLSACASHDGLPPHGMGGVRDQSVLAVRPASAGHAALSAPVDAVLPEPAIAESPGSAEPIDAPGLERSLRDQLATATDPVPAALELADLLSALERHREALAVVDVALQRNDDPSLQVCRAGLLRDLGRRQEAVAALLALAQAHGPAAMHPGLLFECAEMQWLLADADAAGATLGALLEAHAADPWCATNRAALDGLAAELEARGTAPRARVRDLLASLRGNGTVSDRIRLLGDLVALADGESGGRRQHLRTRALAIAAGDESPAVRARAVQLADPPPEEGEAFCRAALEDAAAIVRRFAAERVPECAPAAATRLLLDALQDEADPDAVAAMHAALARLVPGGPVLVPRDETDAAAREHVATAWRQRCSL
jgi:hypothetical protein